MKEPTMTEIEREAEKLADALVDSQSREEDIRLIIHALAHSRPPAGFVRDERGHDYPLLEWTGRNKLDNKYSPHHGQQLQLLTVVADVDDSLNLCPAAAAEKERGQ